MQKFVSYIAEHLVKSEIPLQNWVIILPSERAKQYIQKALFEEIKKPFFAPKMLTVNNWVAQQSKKAVIDKTHLLLELYEIHQAYPSSEIDTSFDEFLSWGRMLMSDFDEIERYLVDSNLLFRNLKDIKEIENWSFNSTEELTENQKKYLAFWDRLGSYFIQLQNKLSEKNTCMLGSVYRNLAENTPVFFQDEEKHYLFAGFNALSKAEMQLFKNLIDAKKGHILFDSDSYYLKDNFHEAGYFIRKFRDFIQSKDMNLVRNELLTSSKEIEIISCSQLTGQVKVAQTLLNQIPEEEFSETMVLLADESLIIPLLQNIPKHVKKANITLGLPLRSTALLTWIELIFNIQEGFIRYKRASIYHKDLLAMWNHPFFNEILSDEERQIVYKKEKEIQSRNIIFQSLKNAQISEKSDAILKILFEPWENSWSLAIKNMRLMNQLLYEGFDPNKEENKLEKAIIQRFDEVIIDFQNCIDESFPEMSLRSFKTLFNQEWTTENIAYYGNPIDGVQVMGLLETRLLDFKNIIVLGLNEGKMPPSNAINSLIPMDLRKFVGLPTVRDKQGLFAHHFYRLLHGAEKVYITYHNGVDSIAFAEKSRFVAQIEMELAKSNPNIKITKRDYTILQENKESTDKKIVKTPEIIEQLDFLFANGLSPSMVKKYFTCPLDFYFQYVLKFGEEKKVEEELESNTFGTLIHTVLENLYQKFNEEKAGKSAPNLTEKDIDFMLKSFEPLLFEEFKTYFNGDAQAFLTGKNFLSYSMSIEMCKQFLLSEKQFFQKNPLAVIRIKALEMAVDTTLELDLFGEKKSIKLKGFIDRVDEIDGQIRILDYKTGKVDIKDVANAMPNFQGTELEYLLKSTEKTKHFFQLMTYLFLFYQKTGTVANQNGIISMVNFKQNPFLMTAKEISNEDLIKFYPQMLQQILEDIYNSSTFFEHNAKSKFCDYC
ncbi:MAG: PD-(D/E)XK nuclease family protein [Flavobacteriia bacterium]